MAGDHECPVCHATFTRPQHVARHMRSHTGDRPYKCIHCGDQFARSDLLSRHVNKCHASEKPPITSAPSTRRKGHAAASTRATTSKQACDQCVVSSLPCDGSNPCTKCINRRLSCTYVKFQRQTAPVGPGHKASGSGTGSISGSVNGLHSPSLNSISSSNTSNLHPVNVPVYSSSGAYAGGSAYSGGMSFPAAGAGAGMGMGGMGVGGIGGMGVGRSTLGLPVNTGGHGMVSRPTAAEELYLASAQPHQHQHQQGHPHQQLQHQQQQPGQRLNLNALSGLGGLNADANASATGVMYHLEPTSLSSSTGGAYSYQPQPQRWSIDSSGMPIEGGAQTNSNNTMSPTHSRASSVSGGGSPDMGAQQIGIGGAQSQGQGQGRWKNAYQSGYASTYPSDMLRRAAILGGSQQQQQQQQQNNNNLWSNQGQGHGQGQQGDFAYGVDNVGEQRSGSAAGTGLAYLNASGSSTTPSNAPGFYSYAPAHFPAHAHRGVERPSTATSTMSGPGMSVEGGSYHDGSDGDGDGSGSASASASARSGGSAGLSLSSGYHPSHGGTRAGSRNANSTSNSTSNSNESEHEREQEQEQEFESYDGYNDGYNDGYDNHEWVTSGSGSERGGIGQQVGGGGQERGRETEMGPPPGSRDGPGGRVSAAFGGMNLEDGEGSAGAGVGGSRHLQPRPVSITLPASASAHGHGHHLGGFGNGLVTPSLSSVNATGILGEPTSSSSSSHSNSSQNPNANATLSEREAEMRELREFWKMYLRTPLSERDGMMSGSASGATPRGEVGGSYGFGVLGGGGSEGDNTSASANANGNGNGRPAPKRGLSKVASVPELRTPNGNGDHTMVFGGEGASNNLQHPSNLSGLLTPLPYRSGYNPYNSMGANPKADYYQHSGAMSQYSRPSNQASNSNSTANANATEASNTAAASTQAEDDLRTYERAVLDRTKRLDKEVVLRLEPSSLRKRHTSVTSNSASEGGAAAAAVRESKKREGEDAGAKGAGVFVEPGLPASASASASASGDGALGDALNLSLARASSAGLSAGEGAGGRPSVKRAPSQTLEPEHAKRTHHSYTPGGIFPSSGHGQEHSLSPVAGSPISDTSPSLRPGMYTQSSMRYLGQKRNSNSGREDEHDGSDGDMDGEDGDAGGEMTDEEAAAEREAAKIRNDSLHPNHAFSQSRAASSLATVPPAGAEVGISVV